MRKALPVLLVAAAFACAEIIDRIAVTVNSRVITESEILRQIRLTAFLNAEKPDFSAQSKRRTADRLVEQALVRREIETTRYITSSGTSKPLYDEIRKRYKDEAAYRRALAEYGIEDQDVRNALDWQATLLEFVSVRFRPGSGA
jgi:glycine betaine/choline ABC-type transport system substrate-binding protein